MNDLEYKKKTLKMLRTQWLVFWIVPAILLLFGNKSLYLDNATAEYVLQVIGVVVTIAAIPICYKFFDLKFARKAMERKDVKVPTIYAYLLIRMGILFFAVLTNTQFYLMTGSQSSLFCIGILLLFSLTIWPTEKDFDKVEK